MVEGFYAWMVAGVVYVVDSTDAMVRIIFRSRYVRKSIRSTIDFYSYNKRVGGPKTATVGR